MKILYLITKSNWGGAQRYVYDLATNFSSRGHDISVAAGGDGELITRLKEVQIKTYSLSTLARDIKITAEIKSFLKIFNLIKDVHPDIIHLNSSKAAGLGAVSARMLGVKKIITTLHGVPFREDRPWIIKKIIYFFTWLTCLFAHEIITVSKQDEHHIAGMWFVKNKVRTIYLGLVYADLPERTNPKGRKIHIVTLAELHRNKGLIYALQAVNNLHKEGLLVSYSIFGEGEDREKLEQFITVNQLHDVVELRGHVKDIADKLHEFDLFLLPSIKEGLPYVLLEAGRAMIPVITTTVGGIPEIVRHEETGLLVQPKDVEHLTNELRRLILDRKFAKKLAVALRSHVVQNFSHSKMIVETSKVYNLIESKK